MAELWLCCLLAVLPAGALFVGGGPCALVDRTFSRAGFVVFVAQGGGEVTRRRKGTGAAVNLVMPRYSNDEPCGAPWQPACKRPPRRGPYLGDEPCGYHGNLHASAHHGAVHTWAMSRAGTMATCTATCDGLHGRQLPERDQRLLTPQTGMWHPLAASARTTKFSVSADAPPALHASAHHGAPALFPTGEPRRAHRDRRRRHLYAHDGATHTPTTAPSTRARTRCTRVRRASLEGV